MIDTTWNCARAASLAERVAGLVAPIAADAPDDEARDDLQRWWRAFVADDVEERFVRRLARMGRTPASIAELLGPVGTIDAGAPPWDGAVATLLRELSAVDDDASACEAEAAAIPGVAFAELLAPLVAIGMMRLRARVGADAQRLGLAAWQQLGHQLARRLASISEPTLALEFAIFRARERSSLERLLALATTPRDDRWYLRFVGRPRRERFARIVWGYPVLARSWTRILESWLDANTEFLQRLIADSGDIAALLGRSDDLPEVEALQTDLSDRHDDGRTVYRVGFVGGCELMYKPRNIDIEARWTELLAWLARRGAPVELAGLRLVARPTHGWVEVAEARPCASADEFAGFYRRIGGLLALVYLFAGNDCHRENLVAVGDRPVLVDVETLVHPGRSPTPHSDDDAATILARRLEHSVLGTAMLPHWSPLAFGGGYDSGGIGPGGTLRVDVEARVPARRNTDEAAYAKRRVSIKPVHNVPFTVAGGPAVADQYVDAIVAGFTAMAEFVSAVRDDLLAGPVAAFASVPVRVLMRSTSAYEEIFVRSLQPRAMRCGAARSIVLDRLVRPLLRGHASDPDDAAWAAVEHERVALERLDIPRFAVRADEDAAHWRAAWTHAGHRIACERIAGLDDREIRRQVDLVRASFDARESVVEVPRHGHEPLDEGRELRDDELREIVRGIVRRTTELATFGAGDSATWITLEVLEDSLAYRLRPMGPGLYNGTAGVGLVLAAAATILDDEHTRALARAAVRSLRSALLLDIDDPTPIGSIGGVMGMPSAAYGLAWMGHLLDDESLLVDAEGILARVDMRAIVNDRRFDVAGGAAGAILVLLAVHSLRPNARLVELAHGCGEHLLRHRTGTPATWTTPSGRRLAGLAHGASGFASALERLFVVTDDVRFHDAALEALAFERTLLDGDAGNWLDLRGDAPHGQFMTSWCNGACGIGMAALLLPRAHGDLDVALATTERNCFGALDHYCCGNVGRADFMLEAGLRLGRPDAVRRSRRVLAAMHDRAVRRGSWGLSLHPHPGSEHPGLFRGLGGIAWLALRHLAPDRLPSIGVLAGLDERGPIRLS